MFNSRVFFGTIAAGVLAAGIAVPAIAATPGRSLASNVKSTTGAATMPVSGTVPGGASLPKGLISGSPAAGVLSGLGLAGLPIITPQAAGPVSGASAPGATDGTPAMNNPVNGIPAHVTGAVPGHTNVASTANNAPSDVKTSLSGRDASGVLKSLPVVGSLTGNLSALTPALAH